MDLFFRKTVESYAWRRSIRLGIAVLLAVIVDHYFSSTHQFWGAIAALVTLTVSLGSPLRQSLFHYFIIFLGVITSSVLLLWISQPEIFYPLALLGGIVVWALLAVSHGGEINTLKIPLILGLILVIGFFSPLSGDPMDRIHDITLGAIVGLIVNLLVFPDQVDKKFQQNSIAYYQVLEIFFAEILRRFLSPMKEQPIQALSPVFSAQYSLLPFWALQPGFNPRLRKSHHYFLSNSIQLTETLFSLDALSTLVVDPAMLEIFRIPLEKYTKNTHELFKVLLAKLENKSNIDIQFVSEDFMTEIVELENIFKEKVSPSLEALSLTKEYIDLADFIRDLKAIRLILIRLVESVLS